MNSSQSVRIIDGEPFCGKCGDHMAAGWREDPFCPTCEFPRCVATPPPGEGLRAERDRYRKVLERIGRVHGPWRLVVADVLDCSPDDLDPRKARTTNA